MQFNSIFTFINRQLTGEDLINYKKKQVLTELQFEVLVGCLLGDASMRRRDGKPMYNVKFEQAEQNIYYIWHLFGVFQNLCGSQPTVRVVNLQEYVADKIIRDVDKELRDGTESGVEEQIEVDNGPPNVLPRFSCQFSTYGIPDLFKSIYEAFYPAVTVDGVTTHKKTVPANIADLLTARSLAYLYMDDGSTNNAGNFPEMKISTEGFTYEENQILQAAMQKNFGIKSMVSRAGNYWHIRIEKESVWDFQRLIGEYIHPALGYKVDPSVLSVEAKRLPKVTWFWNQKVADENMAVFVEKAKALAKISEEAAKRASKPRGTHGGYGAKAIVLDNYYYPSITAAAEANRRGTGTIRKWLSDSTDLDCVEADEEQKAEAAQQKALAAQQKALAAQQKALAAQQKALGTEQKAEVAVKPIRPAARKSVKASGNPPLRVNAKAIILNDVRYSSIAAASAVTGIWPKTISNWLKNPKKLNCVEAPPEHNKEPKTE